ncbi:Multidrug-efflux transporter 3 [Hartmannibacter diazotrophicus]|uniref:Multidrug-efflux transporter 3 n=1 Tax=Hartmannibacter diazotrophicus TaxID=1482074 RepID=A0A2C9DAN4_9HYPH|nr:MDR family MFS transporter [Hartmannibacter diazotrophicus]SON57239.1 Multidrug-efflux transporter 3 [Hartmannibacter diazotrophicus]
MNASPPAVAEEDRLKIVLGALLAMLLAALDQTIVAPALPTIGSALGDVEWLSWVISAYFLTATAVTPLYGKLADIKGRRGVLFFAIGLFIFGSLLCALAPSMLLLVLGRAVQGLGGGGLIALAQTIIADVVPPKERPKYMVYISAVWAFASLAGPVVGGLLAEHVHWSMIFWINLPLATFAIFMTDRALKKLPQSLHDHKLDLAGAVLIMSATVCLMLALTWGGTTYAWGSSTILALLIAAGVLFVVFTVWLGQVSEPLIPIRVLRNPVVSAATAAVFFSMMSFVGLSVYVPLYHVLVQGLTPGLAGVALVAMMIGTVAGANTTGRYMGKMVHYRRLAVGGGILSIISLGLLSLLAAGANFWVIEALTFTAGAGVGTLFPVATIGVQNAVEQRDIGVATGTLSFMRSLGSVIGVAALGAVLLGYGVVEGIGEHAAAAGDNSNAGVAFRALFALSAFGQVLALCLIFMMKELPLRGHNGPVGVTE